MSGISYCSEKISKLAKAMRDAQNAMEPVIKNADNPFTKSKYATLTQVVEACRDVLFKNGLWVTQYNIPAEPGYVSLVTKILHIESEQWQASILTMPAPKNDPQAYGSALTYLRRYGLCVVAGIVCEDDDDANMASGKNGCHADRNPQQGRSQQANRVKRALPAPQQPDAPYDDQPISPHQPSGPNRELLASLPRLDGVRYDTVQAGNGKLCITASGNTGQRKEMLRGAGFQWSGERRVWWRYADAA